MAVILQVGIERETDGRLLSEITKLPAFLEKHSPSITTLTKYAEAVGCDIEIRLVLAPSQVRRGQA